MSKYEVIAEMPTPKAPATREGRVILVERDGEYHRYVTAWQGKNEQTGKWDSSWCWGHYFNTFEEAECDYLERCRRGY